MNIPVYTTTEYELEVRLEDVTYNHDFRASDDEHARKVVDNYIYQELSSDERETMMSIRLIKITDTSYENVSTIYS